MGFLHEIFVNGERSQLSNRCRHGGAVPVPFMGPDLDTGTFTFTFIDFETKQGARVPGLTLQEGWSRLSDRAFFSRVFFTLVCRLVWSGLVWSERSGLVWSGLV